MLSSKQHADPVDRIAAICDDAEGDKLTRIDAVIRGAVETPAVDIKDLRLSWPELQDAIANLIGHDCACARCEDLILSVLNTPSSEPTPRRECVHVWGVSLYRSDTEVCENCGKWRDRAAEKT